MRDDPGEQATAVSAADDVLDVVFRMRHHPEHVAALIDDPGNRMRGPVDVGGLVDYALGGAVAIEHPSLALEPFQRVFVRLVIALAMGDRHADDLPGVIATGERRVRSFDP